MPRGAARVAPEAVGCSINCCSVARIDSSLVFFAAVHNDAKALVQASALVRRTACNTHHAAWDAHCALMRRFGDYCHRQPVRHPAATRAATATTIGACRCAALVCIAATQRRLGCIAATQRRLVASLQRNVGWFASLQRRRRCSATCPTFRAGGRRRRVRRAHVPSVGRTVSTSVP